MRKILAILLSVCLAVCLLTTTVMAMQIYVEVETSSATITLDVEPAETIESIKQKIQDKTGYSPEVQLLYYNGSLLSDGKTLADYNINKESTLTITIEDSSYTIKNALFVTAGTLGISQDMLQWSNVDAPGGYELQIYAESGLQVYGGILANNYIPASDVLTSSGSYYYIVYALDTDSSVLSSKKSDTFSYTHTHTTEIQNAKDATCIEDGYTGDEVCTVCGETITAGTVIAATGVHTYVDHVCTGCGELDCIAFGTDWVLEFDYTLKIYSDAGMSDWTNNGRSTYSSSVISVVIESGVTSMCDQAFYNCTKLTSVSIPDGVTSIGYRAFAFCEKLSSITIPDGVTLIGQVAFSNCKSLTSITIPSSVETIEHSAFYNCSRLETVTFDSNSVLETINNNTFNNCWSLTSITIPSSVKSIGNTAFCNCTSLETVTIESCTTTIADSAFNNTPALTNGNIVINHTTEIQNAKDATCGEDGYTGDEVCTVCGETVTAGEVIPATGNHTYDAGTVTQEATCTEAGEMTYTCTVCGDSYTEEINATGHSWGETVYNFSEDGSACTATRTCENDSSHVETATATITSARTLAPTCTIKGETTYTATFTEEWAETQTLTVADVDATGHTVVTDEAVAATCTETGLTEGSHCSVCQEVLVAQEVVPATGHSWGETVYDFSEDGSACTATRTCENDSNHVETASATITSAQTSDPDCTTKGETTYTATFTEEWAETQTLTVADVDATGHTLTHTEAVDAGCATDGNIEYWYCSVCEKYFSDEACTTEITLEETVTAATGSHTYKAIVTDPTCTEKGYTTYICTGCGDNYRDDYTDPAGHTAGTPVKENYVPVTATKDGYYELATYCTICGEEISRSYTTIAAYGTNVRETINWAAVLSTHANKTTTTVTIEEITITEPVEPGDTETEVDSGDEITPEPETEEEPETNPTTGMVLVLIPMALALVGVGITKKK